MDSRLRLPSERLAHHSVGFSFELRRNGFAAKSPTGGFQTQIKATRIIQEDCKALVFGKQITKVFLITFYSNECLSIKGAEQLRVPSPWLVFLMLDIVKMVSPLWRTLVTMKGPSQAGASLCDFC